MIWEMFNPNPCGKSVGDCSVRAIAAALNLSWDQAFDLLILEARRSCDMPSADSVWGTVLRNAGFSRSVIPNNCPDCYTASDFCVDHPRGVYVLAFGGHVATVRDGKLLDSWDSSSEAPVYFYH